MFTHPLILNIRPSDYFWEGKIILPSWKGFRSSTGFNEVELEESSTGSFNTFIDYPGDVKGAFPSAVQQEAIDLLGTQEAGLFKAVFKKLIPYYKEVMTRGGKHIADISTPEDLKSIIGVNAVHIPDGDLPYIGFELGASWNGEDGLGVLLCKDKVVAIGTAETSFELP